MPGGMAQTSARRQVTPNDQVALQHALEAYDSGNLQAAEPALRTLAARYPSNFSANEALGSLYAEQEELPRALPYLEHAAALAPNQAIAHANLGAAYLKLNQTAKAVHELETAARLEPASVQTQSNLGQAQMLAGKPAAAAQAFSAAAALDPRYPELAYNWALALYQAGDLKHASLVLQAIAPNELTAPEHALAGDVDEKLGDFKAALLHFQTAAHLDPSAANLYSLALELLRHWTWDEALKVATYGAQRYPSDTRFPVAQGIALYADGKYAPAAVLFSKLLAQEPNNELYADLLGRSCNASADFDSEHCGGLELFAEQHPGNAQVATFAATRILQQPGEQQDSAKAEALLHQAIAADPKLAAAYYQLGVLAQQRLQWQESAAMLEKAVALQPSYAEAHYRLSRAYAHLGQREQAQQQMSLHQRYSQEEKDSLNARLQDVVTFLLKSN